MNIVLLFSNRLLNTSVLAWVVAQTLKTIIDFRKNKRFNRQRLAGAGGMPSSHAAVTTSLVITSYFIHGFGSSIFAVSFILALIVMYDATGVRWSAGLHAQAINKIVDYLGDPDKKHELQKMIPTLNESIGHRVIEVICGAILGAGIAGIGEMLMRTR